MEAEIVGRRVKVMVEVVEVDEEGPEISGD